MSSTPPPPCVPKPPPEPPSDNAQSGPSLALGATFAPDPALESEASVAEKSGKDYKKLYETLTDEYEGLYNDVARRDNDITELRELLKGERAKNHRLQQDLLNEQALIKQYQEERDENKVAAGNGSKQSSHALSSAKGTRDELLQWNNLLQSDVEDLTDKLNKLRVTHDTQTADLATAHRKIDALEEQAAVQEPQFEEAIQYMEVIHNQLGAFIAQQGETLTPETFADHIRSLQRESQPLRQVSSTSLDSLDRPMPMLRNQKNRQVSMADELAMMDGNDDDSDREDSTEIRKLNVPKQRTFSSNAAQKAREETANKELKKKVDDYENQVRDFKNQIEGLKNEITEKNTTITAKTRSIIEKDAAINKAAREKQVAAREKQDAARERPPAAEEKKTVANGSPAGSQTRTPQGPTQYAEVNVNASVWEAFCNATPWYKVVWSFFFLICVIMGIGGYSERQFWLQANENVAYTVARANSISAAWNWQYQFEQWLGLDTMGFG